MSLYKAGIGSEPSSSDWAGWLWPVPIFKGRSPVVSDFFQRAKDENHRSHLGVDIMFPRLKTEPFNDGVWTSKHFAMPTGVPALAAGPGKVWSAGVGPKGHFVIIDHGKVGPVGVTTFYQHLSGLSRAWKRGDSVAAGTVLGEIGGNPEKGGYHLRHLHFELWFPKKGGSRESWAVDAKPIMTKYWRKAVSDGDIYVPSTQTVRTAKGDNSEILRTIGAIAGVALVGGTVILLGRK